jgi:hypothetical protein
MEAAFGAGLAILLFVALMMLLLVGFWLWMFIDCITVQNEDKVVWLLVIFFLNFLGALIYYFVARKKRRQGGGVIVSAPPPIPGASPAPMPPAPPASIGAIPPPPALGSPAAAVPPPPVVAPSPALLPPEASSDATMVSAPAAVEATLMFSSAPKLSLLATAGPVAGQSFPLSDAGAMIGRAGGAEIVVADSQISGRHAWVGLVAGKAVVRDQQSTNGTYLNDLFERPVTEQELQVGDVLVLGKHNGVKFQLVAG